MNSGDAPIGVFDSGLGGLTVVREIARVLPHEDLVYLGDTARVPYGSRSASTVVRYAKTCARHLARNGVKLVVVACNTVSAVALDELRVELDVPVLGVIAPGARAGVQASQGRTLGVLATAGTIASGAYPRAVAHLDSRIEVIAHAAPLLVPLVEEGWLDGDVPTLVARRYLTPVLEGGAAAIVLGCTHYPVLLETLTREAELLRGAPVPIVDSAFATATELASLLAERALSTTRTTPGALRIEVTDRPARFAELAARFLGHDGGALDVRAVDL